MTVVSVRVSVTHFVAIFSRPYTLIIKSYAPSIQINNCSKLKRTRYFTAPFICLEEPTNGCSLKLAEITTFGFHFVQLSPAGHCLRRRYIWVFPPEIFQVTNTESMAGVLKKAPNVSYIIYLRIFQALCIQGRTRS